MRHRILVLQGTLAPLRAPGYRWVLISNALWWQGLLMEMTLTGWLALELTDSAWQVALIQFYRSAPVVVVGFFSGALAHRCGRLRLIQASQLLALVIPAVLAWLLWTDLLVLWHLAVGSALLGTSWTLSWTSRRALVPDLVGKARTVDAMLLENFAQSVSRIVGPFAAGALISVWGATACYAAVAVVSATSLLAILGVPGDAVPRPQPAPSSQWAHMVDGLRYARRNQAILGDLLITVAMNFLAFPYIALLPVFARDVLHQGPIGLGLLGGASGVGSFIGLLAVSKVRRRVSHGWILSSGSIFMAVCLVSFSASTNFHLSLVLLIASGIGQACFSVMQSAIILVTARDDMRDRAMGAVAIAIGGGPPGRLQVGALAQAFGAPLAVGITAAAAALMVAAVTVSLPGFRAKTQEQKE
jgi:predicted MFS family arabinose efflux permease